MGSCKIGNSYMLFASVKRCANKNFQGIMWNVDDCNFWVLFINQWEKEHIFQEMSIEIKERKCKQKCDGHGQMWHLWYDINAFSLVTFLFISSLTWIKNHRYIKVFTQINNKKIGVAIPYAGMIVFTSLIW